METETNTITIDWRLEGDNLIKIETPETPVSTQTTYNVVEAKEEIAKIDAVISMWEAKKAPYQEIVDKAVELNPVVEEPVVE